jgi:adenylate cyclase class 2
MFVMVIGGNSGRNLKNNINIRKKFMSQKNIEIKARCKNIYEVINYLDSNEDFEKRGIDLQRDTYYNTINGTRLKMREGNIENALVSYKRDDEFGPKDSSIVLHHFDNDRKSEEIIYNLKEILNHSLGVLVVVNKKRHIYWNMTNHVKIHVDTIEGLGNFVEIEVMDLLDNRDKQEMIEICDFYINNFDLTDFIDKSYSDMIIEQKKM